MSGGALVWQIGIALGHLLLKEHPQMGRAKAVEETAMKFDLSPLEEEWLLRQSTEGELAPDDSSG